MITAHRKTLRTFIFFTRFLFPCYAPLSSFFIFFLPFCLLRLTTGLLYLAMHNKLNWFCFDCISGVAKWFFFLFFFYIFTLFFENLETSQFFFFFRLLPNIVRILRQDVLLTSEMGKRQQNLSKT